MKTNKREIIFVLFIIALASLVYSATFTTINQGDFANGTYTNTQYNTTGNYTQLSPNNLTGNYLSKIFNANSIAQWNNISWTQGAPYQQELPNNQATETNLGGVNMTGNVLLMHLNNDSAYGENATRVYDFSGNNRNGTWSGDSNPDSNSGPTSFGKLNGAFMFDGTGDYFDAGTNPITGTSAFTLMAWINTTNIAGYSGAISIGNSAGSQSAYIGTIPGAIGGGFYGANYNSGVTTTNKWIHLVMTFAGGNNGAVIMYVNGVQTFSTTFTPNLGSTNVRIGRIGTDTIYDFSGSIDEAAIYNRTLSATEILNSYKRGALKLNLSVQSCNDPACSGETFTNLGNNLTSPQTFSITNDTYFQYKFEFITDNVSYTPQLYNVTVNYNLLDVTPPNITLNQPSNNTNTTLQNITFNFTAVEDYIGNINCSLYIDNTFQAENSTTANNTLTNLNATNLASGPHNWSINCTDAAGNTNKSETRLIYVDISAPTVTNILYTPNSTDSIDPGTTITFNATVSDARVQVSSVILQYYNGTTWQNATMTNNSLTNYNTTITTLSTQANYTFNIWRNDTLGNANSTINQTFNSAWDCTWQATSELPAIAGWDENKHIGNITINNTGDIAYSNNNCSLDFRLTYDLAEGRIYYDNEYLKNAVLYTISAGASRNISINATFGTEVKQENVVMTFDEVRARSQTRYRNTTVTLINNQAGPYLYQKLTTYPTSVYLTNTNFSLNAYLRNLMGSSTINENNTAYNVSFYWVLIDGLTNSSGNQTLNFTNITDNDLHYNQVNITFSNLANITSGVKTFYLKSYGYNLSNNLIVDANNNSLLSESFNITFLCYNTKDFICVTACGYLLDPDCNPPETITPSSGSGGGGSSSQQEPDLFLNTQETFELVRGQDQTFTIKLENPYEDANLKNLIITLKGFSEDYISFYPTEIPKIDIGKSEDITIKITAPAYFTQGTYTLKFTIQGEVEKGSNIIPLIYNKEVTLRLLDISREDALEYQTLAYSYLDDMKSKEYNTEEIEKLVKNLDDLYNQTDFGALKELYTNIKEIYEASLQTDKLIQEIQEAITKAEAMDIAVEETKRLLYLTKTSFERGDFKESLDRAKEAQFTLALETNGKFFNKALYSMKNNPGKTGASVVLLTLVITSGSVFTKWRFIKRRLKQLSNEEKLLIELMKSVQIEVFEKAKMSMKEYGDAMTQYEKRLGEVIQGRVNLETKKENLLKFKKKKQIFLEEREKLLNLIRAIQKDYITGAKYETRVYENMLRSYSTRLSEVEEQLALADVKKAFKGK